LATAITQGITHCDPLCFTTSDIIDHAISGRLSCSHLPSAPFPVKKETKIDPDFPTPYVIIGIAAGVKSDQFKFLVKVKPDGICVA
jgi:hypothetical protein